jgi:hypothetical protein
MSIRRSSYPRCLMAGGLSLFLPLAALAVSPPVAELGSGAGHATRLMQAMVGTWSVKEWMWPAPGAKPVNLPPAIARRRLVDGKFLEETMEALPGVADAFTRMSYFDYNAVSGRYEYFSIDTRAPQMMNERSVGGGSRDGVIALYGGTFVAPQWGAAKDAAFRYRLVLGPVHSASQSVELYLTPIPATRGHEFLAFKYLYTRHIGKR